MGQGVHFLYSSQREKLLEHVFLGDLLRCLWQRGHHDVEVLRPEVDRGGYDLAIECSGCLRHIQIKASRQGGARRQVDVQVALAAKPSGCVIWIEFDEDSLALGPFLWFGDVPHRALPDLGSRVAQHSRGEKRERPALRSIAKARFKPLSTIDEIAEALFGKLNAAV